MYKSQPFDPSSVKDVNGYQVRITPFIKEVINRLKEPNDIKWTLLTMNYFKMYNPDDMLHWSIVDIADLYPRNILIVFCTIMNEGIIEFSPHQFDKRFEIPNVGKTFVRNYTNVTLAYRFLRDVNYKPTP